MKQITKSDIIKAAKNLVKNPYFICPYLGRFGLLNWIPDDLYLKCCFRAYMGSKLNLENPQTFNEKLQWLKLYDRNPAYTQLVDKYAVREYIKKTIGEEYLIPLLGVWDSFDEINFDKLPNQFVLKCNHDSGSVIICKDKKSFDIDSARKQLSKALHTNAYPIYKEWPYKNVKPRIIAEKYMEDNSGGLQDYKILCFGGMPKLIEFHHGRFTENHVQEFYDFNWILQSFNQVGYQISNKPSDKVDCLDEMYHLSKILAKDIPHVRVDWYVSNKKLYFGEMTFFDSSGFDPIYPEEWDYTLGSWIQLPVKK